MSKLISLLKATMSEGVQLFSYRGKTERSRRIMPIILGSVIGISMLFSSSALIQMLKKDGLEAAILSLYTLITSVIILTEGIYKSGDLLFKPKDSDMLLAMPIKKSTIVSARIIKFYAFEMLYCLIFLLPAIVAYIVNSNPEPSFFPVSFTMLVLIPVIPIAISCIIGLVSSAISVRFKHRTLIQVIISFVTLFVFAVMILSANTISNLNGQSLVVISNNISKFYYPATTFMNLANNFSLTQYLLFIMINLVVLIITIFLISSFYFKIVTRISTEKRAQNENLRLNLTKHSQTYAMVKKELTKYFSTPVLLMNTAIGLAIFLVAVGALCLNYDGLVSSFMSSIENFPLTAEEIHSFLPSAVFALVAFTSLMTFITATMISLEGKAFNFLKSMPISGKKVILTKVLAAMLLIVPVTLLGSIVLFVRFQFDLLSIILILVAIIAMPLVTELIGILIDLKYARFDAESDAVVVKQSAGVMVATFLGLGMVLITISLTFAIVFLAGQVVGLTIMDAVFIIISLFLYFVIATRGEEKYMKLTS